MCAARAGRNVRPVSLEFIVLEVASEPYGELAAVLAELCGAFGCFGCSQRSIWRLIAACNVMCLVMLYAMGVASQAYGDHGYLHCNLYASLATV